jgi:hypothetical protein
LASLKYIFKMKNEMKNITKIASLALAGCILSVCFTHQVFSQKSYVDPQYHKAGYGEILKLSSPVLVRVNVEFQRNGQPLPAVKNELRGHVERTLNTAGALKPTAEPNNLISISVTCNNIADIAAARSKGFKSGFTFGAAGSMVDDNYEFLCVYNDGSGKEQKYSYQHAIHTWIGKKKPETDFVPTTPAIAFGRVVEDVTLNFIKDLQDASLVPKQ